MKSVYNKNLIYIKLFIIILIICFITYFIYKKGTTTVNKTPYSISIENIANDIYSRIRKNTDEMPFNLSNPEYYRVIRQFYETSEGIFDYIGNPTQNDYNYDEYMPTFYITGFSIDDIIGLIFALLVIIPNVKSIINIY